MTTAPRTARAVLGDTCATRASFTSRMGCTACARRGPTAQVIVSLRDKAGLGERDTRHRAATAGRATARVVSARPPGTNNPCGQAKHGQGITELMALP